jgi:inner membrane protein
MSGRFAAAKAGLGRLSPYSTFVCVAAANLPDIDIVALARGPAFYLQHHRGITHSIVGTLALAVAFPLLFYAAERGRARLRGREPRARLKGLLVCSLLLSASHPLLDWTNSYGVRPWLPWDGSWIYGDLLFVIDPWVWLVLIGACFLLAGSRWRAAGWGLLALAITALFFRVASRPDADVPLGALVNWCVGLAVLAVLRWKGLGRRFEWKVAAAALVLVVLYCCILSVVQIRARAEAEELARGLAEQTDERVLRVAATPVLADPLTWRCLADNEREARGRRCRGRASRLRGRGRARAARLRAFPRRARAAARRRGRVGRAVRRPALHGAGRARSRGQLRARRAGEQ